MYVNNNNHIFSWCFPTQEQLQLSRPAQTSVSSKGSVCWTCSCSSAAAAKTGVGRFISVVIPSFLAVPSDSSCLNPVGSEFSKVWCKWQVSEAGGESFRQSSFVRAVKSTVMCVQPLSWHSSPFSAGSSSADRWEDFSWDVFSLEVVTVSSWNANKAGVSLSSSGTSGELCCTAGIFSAPVSPVKIDERLTWKPNQIKNRWAVLLLWMLTFLFRKIWWLSLLSVQVDGVFSCYDKILSTISFCELIWTPLPETVLTTQTFVMKCDDVTYEK